jgi:hypothetical protein
MAPGPRVTDHMATPWPCSCARRTAAPTSIPRGGRYHAGLTPVTVLIVSVPRSISSTLVLSDTVAALRWLQLWLPTSWPAATTSLAIDAYPVTSLPIMKKVAGTRAAARMSSAFGVNTGVGPSSNVMAATRRSVSADHSTRWTPWGPAA